MTTTTLKLRADLQSAEVVDADGVLYYDVTDPRTGGVLRLFDYEWLIAQKLDGQRSMDELARWTEEQFGFAASRDDLQVYAERLHHLGLMDGTVATAAKPLPAALYASAAVKALGMLPQAVKSAAVQPTPAPLAAPVAAPVTVPVAAPAPTPAPEPAAAKAVSRPPTAVAARPAERPVEKPIEKPIERPIERSIEPERRSSRDEDALMGQQILSPRPSPLAPRPAVTPVQTPVVAPVVAPPTVTPPTVTPPTVTPVAAPEPVSAPQPALVRPKSDVLAAIESLPPPVEEPTPPRVEVPPAALPVQLTPPPALQPEVVSAAPAALVEPAREPSAPTPAPQPVAPPSEPMARPTEPMKPVEAAPVERPVTQPLEPSRPTQPLSPQPMAQERPMPVAQPTQVEKSGGAGKWIVIFLLLAVVAGAIYYFTVMRQSSGPPAVGVSISVAKPEDVTRSYATAAVVKAAEPQPLKIDSDGTVTKVVDENADVQPDAVLVELDAQAKFAKELADLRERLTFYQKKIDSPKTKAKPDQLRDAQQKVAEKQQRLEQVEGLIKKSQLMAPRAGQVSKVMVKVGQAVTAGTEVLSLTDKALAAEIKIPAIEAQGMKVGQDAQLAGSGGPLTARVAALRTEGDYALVQYTLPDNATAKPGDELKLQRAPLSQVVRLPNAVLVEGNKVFVLREGKAATLPVTVADRDGDAVLVQGVPSGEQVITSRLNELHEGTAVRVAMPSAQ